MTHSVRAFAPAPGSWVSIGLIYCYGVLTTASLSKVIPLLGDIGTHLGASPAQFALLISLMTILPAALASVAGSIVDRMGAHRALQIVAVIGVLVNAAYLLLDSLGTSSSSTIQLFGICGRKPAVRCQPTCRRSSTPT